MEQYLNLRKERLASMDMLKGFAIFMVIAGHTIQYLISGDYCDKSAYRVIYSFHMPLFMAISGFFSYRNSTGGGGVNTCISTNCKASLGFVNSSSCICFLS